MKILKPSWESVIQKKMKQQPLLWTSAVAVSILCIFGCFGPINGNSIHEFQVNNGQATTYYEITDGPVVQYQLQHPHQIQQQQKPQQLQQQEQQPHQEERHDIPAFESAHVPSTMAEIGSSGVWQEATSVGHSAWNQVIGMLLSLGLFQLFLIPAILFASAYLIYVAYNASQNSEPHYMDESGPYNYGNNNFWKKSLSSFTRRTIDDLTPKILDAIKEFSTNIDGKSQTKRFRRRHHNVWKN